MTMQCTVVAASRSPLVSISNMSRNLPPLPAVAETTKGFTRLVNLDIAFTMLKKEKGPPGKAPFSVRTLSRR
jgi:hypothetical protein